MNQKIKTENDTRTAAVYVAMTAELTNKILNRVSVVAPQLGVVNGRSVPRGAKKL